MPLIRFGTNLNVPGDGSATGPAIALLRGAPFMAWRGVDDDQAIYYSACAGGDIGTGWAAQQQAQAAGVVFGTRARPALLSVGDRMLMAWRGVSDDNELWWSFFDGETWLPQSSIPGVGSYSGPALTWLGAHPFMAWRGVNDDQRIYYSTLNDQTWSAQQIAHDTQITFGTVDAPALAALLVGLVMVWRGTATPTSDDPSVWFSRFDGTGWSDQAPTGLDSACSPGLVGYGHEAAMAARGPAFRHEDFDSIKYATLGEGWELSPSQGITSANGPSLTVFENRLLMAWRGPDVDHRLYVALSDEPVATPSSVISGRKRV